MLHLFIMKKASGNQEVFCGIGEEAEIAAGYTVFDEGDPKLDENFTVLRDIPLNQKVSITQEVYQVSEFFEKLMDFMGVTDGGCHVQDTLNELASTIFQAGMEAAQRKS